MRKLVRYALIGGLSLPVVQSCADPPKEIAGGDGGTSGSAGTPGKGGSAPAGGSGSGAAGKGGSSSGGSSSGGSSSGGSSTAGGSGGGDLGGMGGDMTGEGGESASGGSATAGGSAGSGGSGSCALTLCGDDCVSTQSSVEHCGACDRSCLSDAHTNSVTCSNGRCNQVCDTGFDNCNRPAPPAADDGCETDFSADASCGTSCANVEACAANEDCENSQCLVPCAFTRCGLQCADTETEVDHCGACDRNCIVDSDTTSVECAAGICEQTCAPGFGNCSQPEAPAGDDGCETNFNNVQTCGSSCANAQPCTVDETCIDGACRPLAACQDTLCDTACVDLAIGVDQGLSTQHCGACDRLCSLANAETADCSGGSCAPICDNGFGNCINPGVGSVDDGCETNLDTGTGSGLNVSDCGACGRNCSSANASDVVCSLGACDPTCAQDFGDCNTDDGSGADDGCETDLGSGTASGSTFTDCGGCDNTCSLTNASSATCAAGLCQPVCDAGFQSCNSPIANDGCETDVNTSADNCGACSRACAATGSTQSTSCISGLCAPICRASFGDCMVDDGVGADDGCETRLDSNAVCGATCATAVACTPDLVCNAGTCGAAAGLAVLTVPFTAGGQIQRYGAVHPELLNLANQSVTVRVYAPGATGGDLNIYFIDNTDSTAGGGKLTPLNSLNSGWNDIVHPIGGVEGAFDPTTIRQVTIEVAAYGAGPWANPTVVYIDRIVSSNGVLNDQFNATIMPMVPSSFQIVPGSTLTWASSLP